MGRALYSVGFWIRETGQALDRLGCRLQGKNHFREQRTSSSSLDLSTHLISRICALGIFRWNRIIVAAHLVIVFSLFIRDHLKKSISLVEKL